jgi:hypothetical protein
VAVLPCSGPTHYNPQLAPELIRQGNTMTNEHTIPEASTTMKPFRHFLVTCFVLGWASFAHADVLVAPNFASSNQAQLPDTTDYEGNFYDFSSTLPPNPILIGAFTFTIPAGDYVTGASISGTFGDQNTPVTALTDLFVLNGTIQVGACDSTGDPCATGAINGSLVPWSTTFNRAELQNLAPDFAAGSLNFTAVQNSFGAVIVGTPALDLQIAPVPEPSLFPLVGGFLAVLGWRRRK